MKSNTLIAITLGFLLACAVMIGYSVIRWTQLNRDSDRVLRTYNKQIERLKTICGGKLIEFEFTADYVKGKCI